jgi:hypothetical protein
MMNKRFRTRRQWHNTVVWAWSMPFLVLVGLIIAVSAGRFIVLWIALALSLGGLAVALFRDMGPRATYRIAEGRLVLSDGRKELKISRQDISDASLIDRRAARDYILQRVNALRHGGRTYSRKRLVREMVRFCTVDIGLTSLSLGMGRSVIDRMPKAKHDLVLLRLRDGSDLLLSPVYNQDMVDSISRLVRGV